MSALTGCSPAWERMDAPDIKDQTGLSAVEGFVAAHGWNMTQSPMALALPLPVVGPRRPLKGLPWTRLADSTYPAVTCKGILYVALEVKPRNAIGVAYNPSTNQFPKEVAGFKPLGDHWYVWNIVAEDPAHRPHLTRRYEGKN